MARIRVFVAEDSPDSRWGMICNLATQEDFELLPPDIKGMEEAYRLPVEIAETETLIRRWKPDVVVMDIRWSRSGRSAGIEAAQRIKQALPATRILAYSGYNDRDLVLRAVKDGRMDGYIPKDDYPSSRLPDAIRTVARGLPYFVPEVVVRLLELIRDPDEPVVQHAGEPLNETEREVLQALASGQSNPAIAESTHLGPSTVKSLVHSIYGKLGVYDGAPDESDVEPRVMAILKALRRGLLVRGDLTPAYPDPSYPDEERREGSAR
jgi:two-component system, NarL family, nitrate/nitrite response regulator NarL